MSTTPIPIWTLFSEVLVQHCVPCKADPNSSSRPRRRISEIDTWLEPPAKKRLKEDTDRYQRSNGVSLGKIKSGRKSQEWILARQWLEQLGSISSLPCGHQLDPVSLPPLSVTFQEGTIMAKLNGDDILAVRQDDPDDQSWAEFATRNSLHNRTLFSALEAFKFSKQITVDVSLVRPDSSSVLQIGFSVSLHQSLFSHSLSCPRDIDTAMQDLMYFVFPPPKDPSHNYTENAIKDLYTHLKPVTTAEPPPGIQPEALNPQLLPFQRQTVAWCLKRECGVVAATGEVRYKEPAILEKLPFSWEQVSTPSGVDLFINRLCGLMCLADPDLVATEPEPRGGILAEEMGLGKTVEMLALILLNRRKLDISESDSDTFGTGLERHLSETSLNDSNRVVNKDVKASTGKALIKSTATLIITPPSILHQWANEIENHAPSLRVFIYNQQAHEQISAEQLAQYDVVITTYTVLSKEINFTNEFDRPRRHKRQYVPRKSPFIQIEWWRVCLDEAQMIEGGTVSQAAAMAFLIPRVMSWAVSGTPIRRNVADLQSLLMFLNQEPIASNKHLWRLLTSTSFRSTFISNHQRIMHRFAKKDVVQELALPPQLELAYGIHFTEIERTNYNEKWEQCLTECNFETTTDDSEELEKLRSWFVRLRQICCHPQIGSRNKESLGKTNLRTIDEVLDAMVQQNNSQLHIKERTLFTTKLKRAVLTARIHNDMAEMNLFTQLALEAQRQVEFWDAKVQEQGKSTGGKKLHQARAADGDDYMDQEISDNDETQTEVDDLGRIKSSAENPYSAAILRRRDWQEQHHRTLFFTACFYHDLEMEVEEVELYKRAEEIRQKILAPPEKRFDRLLAVVNHSMRKMNLCDDFALPASQFKGGIVLSQHLEQLEFVTNVLNKQMIVLGHWRQDLIDRLTQPLMQDGEEGEQYQYSIDLQHTLESYLHFYGRMLSFRRDLISGTEEALATHVSHVQSQREHEAMAQRRKARIQTEEHGLGECSKEKEEGLDRRLEREMNDLITLDLVSTLRSIRVGIKSIANDTLLPREEKQMAEMEDLRLKEEQNRQSRLVLKLEKEISLFRTLTAARMVYYRQLQAISDTVRDIESISPETDIDNCLEDENKLQTEIVRLVSKQRYLEHLAGTTAHANLDDEKPCLICRSQYTLGLMTECGHVFCEPCLLEWTKCHSKCPSCNSQISRKRLARVTMSGSTASGPRTRQIGSSSSHEKTLEAVNRAHYRALPRQLVPEAIRRIVISDGYGSKIDSIVRHVVYLVRENPETKCLIFSQWASLLKLVEGGLTTNQIGFVKLDGASVRTAVSQFKECHDKHVFMLHAKSQSAGLTLLSATHIFICEPLVNPVLQAQAVSRVHRIGQTKETFVHYYLIQNTVEIPCFDLFERNQASLTANWNDNTRCEHDTSANLSQGTASEIATAQDRNGELVQLEDLKYCFQMQKQINISMS